MWRSLFGHSTPEFAGVGIGDAKKQWAARGLVEILLRRRIAANHYWWHFHDKFQNHLQNWNGVALISEITNSWFKSNTWSNLIWNFPRWPGKWAVVRWGIRQSTDQLRCTAITAITAHSSQQTAHSTQHTTINWSTKAAQQSQQSQLTAHNTLHTAINLLTKLHSNHSNHSKHSTQ